MDWPDCGDVGYFRSVLGSPHGRRVDVSSLDTDISMDCFGQISAPSELMGSNWTGNVLDEVHIRDD